MSDTNIRALEVSNLEKRFDSVPVIKCISFSFSKGQTVAVIGPSGSGKSTLARCICGLENIDAGRIRVCGEDIGGLRGDFRTMSHLVGMIFQQFNLWPHLSVLENVTFAPQRCLHMERDAARDLGMRLLTRVGLGNKAERRPSSLSGGEQQRVAIARALAMSPTLLVFDEPTSALDPELVGEVLAVMEDLAADGVSMLVITHEMQFAHQAADRVLFMAEGVIQEEGTPAQLFEAPQIERTRQFLARTLNL